MCHPKTIQRQIILYLLNFNKKEKLPLKTLAHFEKVWNDEPLEIQTWKQTWKEREFCLSCFYCIRLKNTQKKIYLTLLCSSLCFTPPFRNVCCSISLSPEFLKLPRNETQTKGVPFVWSQVAVPLAFSCLCSSQNCSAYGSEGQLRRTDHPLQPEHCLFMDVHEEYLLVLCTDLLMCFLGGCSPWILRDTEIQT